IKYGVPEAADVTLTIFDLTGRKVRTLVDKNQEAGWHNSRWDGETDAGTKVGTGMYFYRLKAGDFTRVKKMIIIK
ncbi:MAG: FlgD immunoglobulin-like domain containing protein, partial [Desulfobacterales bacterium]